MSAHSELRTQQLIRYGEARAEAAAATLRATAAKAAGDAEVAKAAEAAAAKAAAVADAIFAEFVGGIWPCLLFCAYRVLRDVHLSEDASQRALVKIVRALQKGQWNPKRGTVCWAYQIVQNEARDMCRHRERQQCLLHRSSRRQKSPAGEASPLDSALSKEFPAGLRAWLRRYLTRQERRLLYFRFVKGMTLKEIAQKMGHGTTHVHTQLSRLLVRLRELMDEDGLGEGENVA